MTVKYSGKPVLYSDITDGLKKAGLEIGDSVIVHCSMSEIGWILGGEETIIRALIEVVGEKGTIVMPSQTWKNLDPSTGVHWEQPKEWWAIIRENWPAYDKEITTAIAMGKVAEMFRKWPNAKRSDHPARSFAAWGRYAEYITKDHDLSNIFGEDSPLDKLYELDGKILLLGVGHNKNTSLHLGETRAEFSKKYTVENSAIKVDSKRKWISYKTLDVDDEDFLDLGEEFNRENVIGRSEIGEAEIFLINQRELVDYAVNWFNKNRK